MASARLPRDFAIEVDGDDSALDLLARGAFQEPSLFVLHEQVAHLSLVQGFDQLLSLETTHVEPFPYQRETAQKVLRRFRGRALLCDEVGLGKTIEAALVLKEYLLRGLVRKVLILTPPALVGQWQEELATKFGLDLVTHEDPEFRALGSRAWETWDQVIASINTARSGEHAKAILAQRYDLVIVDEAHHLKNRASVTWQFVNQLDRKFMLLLTATPIQNSLEELFSLITLLKPGQLRTMQAFKKEFVTRGDPRLPRNRARLQGLLADVMIRNTRSQVGLQLPRRRATTLRLALSAEERTLYDAVSNFVRGEYASADRAGRGLNRFTLETLQMEIGSSSVAVIPTLEAIARNPHTSARQRQEIARLLPLAKSTRQSAKADALLKLLGATREKVIVFTKYVETLHFLARTLAAVGISTAVYEGSLSREAKDARIAEFESSRQVLLCTEAAGEGRNLQFCHTMVNFDLPWNPMRIEQRVGRIHRVGQEHEVSIYNLSAEETVEDYILWLLDSKINMFEMVIGEMDLLLGNLADERDFADVIAEIWLQATDRQDLKRKMDDFGEELLRAKQAYQKAEEYDERVFGHDYEVAN